MLIFLLCMKCFFLNAIKVLSIIHQNKSKMPKKIGSAWSNYKMYQVASTIYNLLWYRFWCYCKELSDEMGLTIRIRILLITENIVTQFVSNLKTDFSLF